MRWVRQDNSYTCGPVALANALKWSGESFSYKKRRAEFIKLTKCDKDGTHDDAFESALRHLGGKRMSVRRRVRPGIDEIERWLCRGGAIVGTMNFLDTPHFALIVDVIGSRGDDLHYFVVINSSNEETVEVMGRERFKRLFLRKRDAFWFLRKR